MPKMKTNRSAAKRFKVTGTGKVRRRRAGMRHILSTKARKRKRHARRGDMVAGSDLRALHRLLPYGF